MKQLTACLVLALTALVAAFALAQHDSGGGGVGCGDVFGDLIEVLRDATSGQPILQKRWVELPKRTPGYGWGYCKIAIDKDGNELSFAPLSCDVAEADLPKVLPVDYFGRLNGGRTKERNSRMHFNEVLSTIKEAEMVQQESAGRLRFGYDCQLDKDGYPQSCTEWSIVDSPMESLGLYTRLMKYGHLQTDPLEKDAWAHGDPATLPIQYNPALTPNDWKKFHRSVWHLLPGPATKFGPDPWACFSDSDGDGTWEPEEPYIDVVPEEAATGNGVYDFGEPFADLNGNGLRDEGADTFAAACATAHDLDGKDFSRGASFLGGAANKTGKVTTDLVQYLNRILKITLKTTTTVSTTKTLGALVRDCPSDPAIPNPEAEPQVEPTYNMNGCTIDEADVGVDPDKVFPDLHERFVDFAVADFTRGDTMDEPIVTIIRPEAEGSWVEDEASLMDWLAYRNGVPAGAVENIDGFVAAGNDAVRTIEFIHNYAIPEDLWDFVSVPTAAPDAKVKVK